MARAREIRAADVPPSAGVEVETPVRAHLMDGGVVVFSGGVAVDSSRLVGTGMRWSFTRTDSVRVSGVALDSVVALETFREGENDNATLAASIPLSIVGGTVVAGGAIAIFKAIFGSCPTIYSDSAGVALLEAEGFSYSIAPLFEMRDVDRLRARADADGVVTLEVRNEALETHYTDRFGLIEVRHEADELIVPDQANSPLALRRLVAPASARDRFGRDLLPTLASRDGAATRASDEDLRLAASGGPTLDYVELAIAAPAADSAALLLGLRNSLLNTILLYEFMLEHAGAEALDWLGEDLSAPLEALQLGRWYVEHMGLRVQVRDGDRWHTVARVGDSGPIAWKDVAVVVPVLEPDSLRVRVVYLADAWRVDRAAFALGARHPEARMLDVASVTGADHAPDDDAARALRAVDGRRLVTTPTDRYWMRFEAGPHVGARTFLLDARGYYTEWIRPEWLRASAGHRAVAFSPDDDVLPPLIGRWADVRD
ncbi:MAG TPA: hypothetical protein VF039_08665, partial [Longimicrobiales bacterium]